MKSIRFFPLDEVASCLEDVVTSSPADEVEVVWLQRKRGWVGTPRHGALETPRLTVLIRVVEAGRLGFFRTETPNAGELKDGVRQALAMASQQPQLKKRPLLPTEAAKTKTAAGLHDRQIARFTVESAQDFCRSFSRNGESSLLQWSESRLVVFNSHGLRRSAAVSDATLEVQVAPGQGCGRAAGSARILAQLTPEDIAERAFRAHGQGAAQVLPQSSMAILLAPEAVIELLALLNVHALSRQPYLDGPSFLHRHFDTQLFAPDFNLRDDGTQDAGLAFPFDFAGSPKRPLDLVIAGKPQSPALDRPQSAQTGLAPTAQVAAGEDAWFGNLFLLPGEARDEDLLVAADEGIRIGWLERLVCLDPAALRFQGIARCVRRIHGGRLGAVLPDCRVDGSLLQALAGVHAVGQKTVLRATAATPLGGISAPALVLAKNSGWRLLPLSPKIS